MQSSLNNLALLYSSIGRYEKAEPLFVQAVEIGRETSGKNKQDSTYAINLNNLALYYLNMGQYEKAEPLYLESKEIRKKTLGENHPDYALSLYHLALLYARMGRYSQAESLFIQSTTILKKTLGETDRKYAYVLNGLAELYRTMGQYSKAEQLYIQAIEIRKKTAGVNHPDYASNLITLAGLYTEVDQYKKAEQLYLQAKEIYKKTLGENHPDYAADLTGLAELFRKMGQYEKAEPVYLQVLEILKKTLGENHPEYATTLNNLATLYRKIGQYEKAELLYLQALEIRKKTLGENHSVYAEGLDNLAELYVTMGQYDKASSLYLQAEEILRNSLGENHPSYAINLNNLAMIYSEMGKYDLAASLYIESIKIKKNALGENHPGIATSLNNLAGLYKTIGQYEKAEALYIQAKEILKNSLGENHPDYAITLDNLAAFYSNIGEYKKAEPLFLSSGKILMQNTINTFAVLSEKEKGIFLQMNFGSFELASSLLFNQKINSGPLVKANFDQLLFLKSLALFDTRNILQSVYNSKDSSLKKLFIEWQSGKSLLSKQYSLQLDERMPDLKNRETQTENLEKELSRRSSAFRDQQKAVRTSMEDVQGNLADDEAAIEFVRFSLYNKNWTDSIIYAAYVVRKNVAIPQFIPLCEEKQLVKFFQAGSAEKIKSIYRSDVVDEQDDKAVLGDSLYNLIWKPLLPYLDGIKKIDYSPAGLLYKIAFHALPVNDKELLLDKYELNQLISLREIIKVKEQNKNANNNIVLFGDCAFTMDSLSIISNPVVDQNVSLFSSTISRGNAVAWRNLPGTAEEVNLIHSMFEKNKMSSFVYTQQRATEEKFKSLSGNSPAIIHLATHGFFLADPEKKKREGLSKDDRNSFTMADDPLMRSGIVLSGANRVWSGLGQIEGREDGIVTADEISQLDLRKTNLVVLSACETALGDVKGNEGVFGLQRAFKMAGVKNMILSLWSVPDKETAELMSAFYSYYMQGKPVRTAFLLAQKDMRAKYKPFYWAAFVLIE
jgi:tetratricopeptide (TPR) repeat protein